MRLGEWIDGKIFRKIHGSNLVYNICWEDPRINRQVLNIRPKDELLLITFAGCNALSYALSGPKRIYAVDMNYRQNALLELKIAGIRELDYETFFDLFGTGFCEGVRELYKTKLRRHLSIPSQKYWDKKIVKYFGRRGKTFYFCGTAGVVARLFNFYADRCAGIRQPLTELLACNDPVRQRSIWYDQIRDKFWRKSIRYLVGRDTLLSLLGVQQAQRRQIEKTYMGGIVRYIQDCLDAVFGELPISDNYFWRLYCTGTFTKTCCPDYLEEDNFNALKAGLVDRINIYTDTIEGFLKKHDGRISRFVLLDHFDWLSDQQHYKDLVAEWQEIVQKSTDDARILWHCAGPSIDFLKAIPIRKNDKIVELGQLLITHSEEAAELHRQDRVHTYGSFWFAELRQEPAKISSKNTDSPKDNSTTKSHSSK